MLNNILGPISAIAISLSPARDTLPINILPTDSSFLVNLPARCIGPLGSSINNARITDIAVYEKEPQIFYIGSCGGGVFQNRRWRQNN